MVVASQGSLVAWCRLSRRQRQAIACPSVGVPYVQQVITAHGVTLPADFVAFYSKANGTPELYPEGVDENFCSFLPVEALQTEVQEWLVVTAKAATRQQARVTVFISFLHACWEYGVLTEDQGEGYRIGILPGANEFVVLTTSLATFLQWYVEDADVLYDSSHPFTELGRAAQP
ncbi:hypothetical protein [Hymenobacter volaticus]|uniref:SMI1/KNR4 family protein n=1 Tax=Hymenobacter volaticus TaxID=2932254 RepID=A0ABY4GFD3_9BACT|nr:hypothetical protein [Hymenobacter volaticus]UOQ69481.1 hypothetical protein MUN86_28810 [Hymenobacter volaticus]